MLIASAVGVTLYAVVFVFGFAVGASIGLMTGEAYHSKRECRECMRRVVRHGFSSDGKNYSAVEDGR
jgi:hypothetical protein